MLVRFLKKEKETIEMHVNYRYIHVVWNATKHDKYEKKVSKDFSSTLSMNLTFSSALQEITLNKALYKYR